ncbi:MAG: amino acid ABC transporter permease [Clostridiales Family XIII bacterium]|jgi:polar amino acid transport system permease protein|nr:amino acid ABC transporter permease [Clostridiales Family XIII bacterium]
MTGFTYFEYIFKVEEFVLQGVGVTLQIYWVTLFFAIPLGLFCALGKLGRFRSVRLLLGVYTWIFRGTPLLLQLFFVYYGLPAVTGKLVSFQPLVACHVTFVVNYAAYFTEIFRAGIQSVDRGQYEAANALGMTRWKSMRWVILPQAARTILPPTGNEAINLIKDTALCSVIAVGEILRNAVVSVSRDMNVTAYVIAALIYLAFTFVIIQLFRFIEKKLSYY